MLLSTRIKLVVLVWAFVETLAFLVVAHVVGVGGALLTGFITTLLGAFLLKRTGAAAMLRLRATLTGRDGRVSGELLDDMAGTFAALALLLPGFLTDVVGIALALPPVRSALIRRLRRRKSPFADGRTGTRQGSGTIDLDPREWSVRADEARPQGVASRP